MTAELGAIVTAAALADLIEALEKAINTLNRRLERMNDTGSRSPRLSTQLRRFCNTLKDHQNWLHENPNGVNPDTLRMLELCISCSRLLLAHVDRQISTCSSKKSLLWKVGMIARMEMLYQDWRLGQKIARQIEAFDLILWVGTCIGSDSSEVHLARRRLQIVISQVKRDTVSVFGTAAIKPISESTATRSRRYQSSPNSREAFIPNLQERLCYISDPSTPLNNYVRIQNLGKRSRYLDRALAEDMRRRRKVCRIFIGSKLQDAKEGSSEEKIARQVNKNEAQDRTSSPCGHVKESILSIGLSQLHLYQLGLARTERRKWIHQFDQSDIIIYIDDLSSYCIAPPEYRYLSTLKTSLSNFENILRLFKQIPIILIFTNVDRMGPLLQTSPMEKCFPEYRGGADVRQVIEFILGEYRRLNQAGTCVKPVFATSDEGFFTESMCFAIQEIMLHKAIWW